MALDAILKVIQAAGEAQIKEIDLEQKRKTSDILSSAAETSQKLEKKEYEEQLQIGREQEALILQNAGLKAARIKDQAVEDFLQKIWGQVKISLETLRLQEEYPAVLQTLVSEVLSEFEQTHLKDKELIFDCDPRDQETLNKIFADLGFQPQTSFMLSTWGGVILRNRSGSLKIDNTLETRLGHSRDFLNRIFLKKLHLAKESP